MCRHRRLFKSGRHQSIDRLPVFCTFTNGVDVRITGLHLVIDQDAATGMQAAVPCQLYIRCNACSHHHGVTFDKAAVRDQHALHSRFTQNAFHPGTGDDLNTQFPDMLFQLSGTFPVQLVEHQVCGRLYDGHIGIESMQGTRCFQTQQAATDDNHAATTDTACLEGLRIGQVTKGKYTRQANTRYRRNPGT